MREVAKQRRVQVKAFSCLRVALPDVSSASPCDISRMSSASTPKDTCAIARNCEIVKIGQEHQFWAKVLDGRTTIVSSLVVKSLISLAQ